MDPEEDLPRNYYTTIAPGAAANLREPPAIPSSSGSTTSTTNNDMSLSSLPQSVLIVRGNNDDDSNFHSLHEYDNAHDHDDDDDDDDDDDNNDDDGYNGGNSSNSKIHYSNKKNNNRSSSSSNHHRQQREGGGGGVGSIRSSGIRTTAISASSHRSHYHHHQQKNKQHRQSSSTQHKSVFVPRELSLPNSSRRAAAAKARRNDCDGGGGEEVEKIEYYSSDGGSDVDDVNNYNDDDNDDSWEMERDKRGITSSKKNSKKSSTKVKKQQHFESTIDDKNDWAMEDKDGGGDGRKHDPKQRPRHRLLLEQQKQQQQQHYHQQEQGGSGVSSSDHGQRQSQRHHHRRRRHQHKNDSHVKSAVEDDMNDKEGKNEEESDDGTLKGERNRTNSPELNIHRRTVVDSSSSLLPPPPLSSSIPRASSSPSSSSLLNSGLPTAALDPKEDDTKSYFSRLDAPPTPMGPERNICRIGGESAAVLLQLPLVPPATSSNISSRVDGSGDGGGGCVAKDENYCRTSGVAPSYNNYILDEEGIRQYRQHHGKVQGKDDLLSRQPQKTAATMKEQSRASVGIADNTTLPMTTTRISQMNIQDGSSSSNIAAVITDLKRDRKADPPALGRGCDPTPLTTPVIYRRRTSVEEDGGGKKEKDARKESSRRKKDKSQSSSSSISKSRKPIQVKSILKKRDAPIPITQFGKPVITKNDDEEDADRSYGGDGSESSSGSEASDPDVIERKQKAASASTSNKVQYSTNKATSVATSDNKDEDSKCSMTTAKSGLRKGKYAALNDSFAKSSSKKDRSSRSSNNDDNDDVGLNTVDEAENDDRSDTSDSSNSDDDANDADAQKEEATFDSPIGNNSQRYDRSQSHYMRTADLGMTQDTIFPEQFMEDPKAKPEPHYHHPSPHPPPGVVFHIDENWICLDDGKTESHSPIAPQAVDALVDMGYRAASNPMMWTPNVKTRKYMTEKGLRFDDIPIPGPLDEGDGTPGDTSSVLVWSGKFPHKYHGHDVPAIRSQGIINMSPEALVDLLMDSNRVREYNKSSIGRDDELVLSDGTNLDSNPFSGQRKKRVTGVVMRGAKVVDGNAVFDSETDDEQSEPEEGGDETMDDTGSKSVRTLLSSVSKRERHQSRFVGVTKLVRTKNKPPLVRKVLEFVTLLHCRELTDDQGGDGYIIVARAVTPASEAESNKKGVVRCEILLNVHIIRRLRNEKKKSTSQQEKGKGGKCKNISMNGKKAGKGDLANRCLLINVNHMKSPLVPSLVAKSVGLSAALNFITDIRATS